MTTSAETLKTEWEAGTWSNYGSTPDIGIRGLEDIQGIPPDEGILLKNRTENPEWAFNGQKITRPDNIVDVEIIG